MTLSKKSLILNEEGQPIRLVRTCQDITELRKADQAMQEYAARLQTLSRRLLEVQEEERRHLARELHDEVGQMLTGLRLILNSKGDLTAEDALATLRSGGLVGMRERLTLLGGRLTIESRPGAGTQITAELPLSEAVRCGELKEYPRQDSNLQPTD